MGNDSKKEKKGDDSISSMMELGHPTHNSVHSTHSTCTHCTHSANETMMTTAINPESTKRELMDVKSTGHPLQTGKALRTSLLVLCISLAGGVAFLVYGITQAQATSSSSFETRAKELCGTIETSWREYEHAALGLHNICRRRRQTTRHDFREFYEYLVASGLEFDAAECAPNITQAEREAYEKASREFYAEYYPSIDYQGIVGFVPDPNLQGVYNVVPSPPRDIYVPVQHVEPVMANAPAIDLDMYSHPPQQREIDMAFSSRQPVVSKRLTLVQETEDFVYSVIIYHPGILLESEDPLEDPARDLSLLVVRIPSLLRRVAKSQEENMAVYLYDTSLLNTQDIPPEFLGAGEFRVDDDQARSVHGILETDYDDLVKQREGQRLYQQVVPISKSGTWIVAVIPVDDTFDPIIVYVLVGGVMILLAGMFVATWIYRNAQRDAAVNEERVAAQAERAALTVNNAQKAAQGERELNDFLAHEVRNPLAAAISATSFIASAINDEENPLPLHQQQNSQSEKASSTMTSLREDVGVVTSSLEYANDLLRNMLDLHRASSQKLHLSCQPTNLRNDIMEPIATIIYNRHNTFSIEIDCDDNLVIDTDRIRLKQIILNLASNSCKFVERGFVRIRATVEENGNVVAFVEDSGPGIPMEKRGKLFEKFQSSLDLLSQGTGIGLSLCKTLIDLMGGSISLDESFDSGVPGCPGARFVLNLNTQQLDLRQHSSLLQQWEDSDGISTAAEKDTPLPTQFHILFVDDDMMLRKLFGRGVKRAVPTWEIDEAANGETAVRLVEEADAPGYDLIFLDQYMSSIKKQMLGTETVRVLRSKGFGGKICGLSANSMEDAFLDAGADAFMCKPFPCETKALRNELHRVIHPKAKV